MSSRRSRVRAYRAVSGGPIATRPAQRRALGDLAVVRPENEGPGETAEGRVGGEELLDLLAARAAARGSPAARPASRSRGRPTGSASGSPRPYSPRQRTVHVPIPGIASRRRSASGSSQVGACPAATSRATLISASARDGARSIAASSAGAAPAIVAASGTSRRRHSAACSTRPTWPGSPGSPSVGPQRPTMRRWIAAARADLDQLLVTAHASASHGHGRRRGRSQGRRRIAGPSSGRPGRRRRSRSVVVDARARSACARSRPRGSRAAWIAPRRSHGA